MWVFSTPPLGNKDICIYLFLFLKYIYYTFMLPPERQIKMFLLPLLFPSPFSSTLVKYELLGYEDIDDFVTAFLDKLLSFLFAFHTSAQALFQSVFNQRSRNLLSCFKPKNFKLEIRYKCDQSASGK